MPAKPKAKAAKAAKPAADLIVYVRRPIETRADGGLLGELDEVILPSPGWRGWDRQPIRWAVVPASSLIPSHRPGSWSKDTRYPAGVQERDYGPTTRERLKVESQIATFEPRLMLSDSRTAIDGPPIVTNSGIVLGGNSRTMTAIAVYSDPARAVEAKGALVRYLATSKTHGDFPTASLLAIKDPILVRIVQGAQQDDPAWMREIAARANLPLTQSLDQRRSASSAAARLDPDLLRQIGESADPDESVSEWLAGNGGRIVLEALRRAGVLTSRTEPEWTDGSGRLHAEGRARALRVLAAAVVDDAELLDQLPPGLLDELAGAAAPILSAAHSGHDVRPWLRSAVAYWVAWKASGKAIRLYDRQVGLGEVEADDAGFGKDRRLEHRGEQLAFRVLTEKRGPRLFASLWRSFAAAARDNAPGSRLLGDEKSTLELLQGLLGAPARLENPTTADRWVALSDGEGGNLKRGDWPAPEKKIGASLAELARKAYGGNAPPIVVAWGTDPLGTLFPVARASTVTGRGLAAPSLRLANPLLGNHSHGRDNRTDYGKPATVEAEREALGLAIRRTQDLDLRQLLSWLLGESRYPGNDALRKLRKRISDKGIGGIVYPWGETLEIVRVGSRVTLRGHTTTLSINADGASFQLT